MHTDFSSTSGTWIFKHSHWRWLSLQAMFIVTYTPNSQNESKPTCTETNKQSAKLISKPTGQTLQLVTNPHARE